MLVSTDEGDDTTLSRPTNPHCRQNARAIGAAPPFFTTRRARRRCRRGGTEAAAGYAKSEKAPTTQRAYGRQGRTIENAFTSIISCSLQIRGRVAG